MVRYFSLLYLKIDLKGHSQLWDRADLDTSFASLKSIYLNLKLNVRDTYMYCNCLGQSNELKCSKIIESAV